MSIIIDLKRLSNESDEEVIFRICGYKDQIGSWQDVANILNQILGNEYTESKYRKQYSTFRNMLNANQSHIFNDDNYIKQLRAEKEAIRKERIKLQTENVERGRVDRGISRQELYYEHVGSLISTLPLPDFQPLFDIGEKTEMSYLCCISDPHYGATFESENNIYSPEIFVERLESLSYYLYNFIQEKKINKLYIACLGDVLQGVLRISDLRINDTGIVRGIVEVSRLLAKFLNELSRFIEIEYYHVPTANHSQLRPLGSKANELVDEDLEYVVGNYIKDLCANNPRIHVNLAEDYKQYIKINIPGFEVLAMHGHQIKNIETSLRDLSIIRNSLVDYLFLGHFHNGRNFPSGESVTYDTEVIVCPSFIGSDPYSDSIMKGSKAAVKIYGFDEVYGLTETYKYILN